MHTQFAIGRERGNVLLAVGPAWPNPARICPKMMVRKWIANTKPAQRSDDEEENSRSY